MESDENTVVERPRRRWHLASACGAGAGVCLAALGAISGGTELAPASRLAALAALTASLLLLVSVGWAACGRRPIAERLGMQPGLAGPGVVLLLAAGLLGLSHALDRLVHLLDLHDVSQLAHYDAAIVAAPEAAWPWLLLGLAVAPGIGEEIFFRGLVQRGLGRWLGRAGAIVTAAAAFAIVHGDPVHAAGAFGLGLYLGSIAETTGGTRAAIACHVVNNLAAVGGLALPHEWPAPPGTSAAAGFVLAVAALWGARRILRRTG